MTELLSPSLLVLVSALLVGIAGSLHCVGMCGGIAMNMTFALPEDDRRGAMLWRRQCLFGLGRVISYMLLGALAGLLGGGVASLGAAWAGVPLLVSALLMVLLALHLLGASAGIQILERAGLLVWRRVQPLLRPLLPITSAPRALAVGMGWGLLPCGLVYSALALAVGAGGPLIGALVMLVFGLVTIPPVAIAGVIGGSLALLRHPAGRWLSALAALLIAGLLVWQATGGGHHQHGHPAPQAEQTPSHNHGHDPHFH